MDKLGTCDENLEDEAHQEGDVRLMLRAVCRWGSRTVGGFFHIPNLQEVEIIDGRKRSDIRPGQTVEIVLKADQRTGKRTQGIVKNILTNSSTHPHGIKVRLEDGQVGRVKAILEE